MNKNSLLACLLLLAATVESCNNQAAETKEANLSSASAITDSAKIKGSACDISLPGIHFTRSVNGADTLATLEGKDKLKFRVGEKKDYFNDPNGQLSNNNAPILLAKTDNTKPFTLVAKVTPGFTDKGLYNAGVLYIYVNDTFWQKHCFEQDERGQHRIVTVRTLGTSDDNNHDVVTASDVYMKISSDTRTVASYYSTDKATWHLVRLYKNNYPSEIWLGVSAQCPVDTGTTSYFAEVNLEQNSVTDFRLGN